MPRPGRPAAIACPRRRGTRSEQESPPGRLRNPKTGQTYAWPSRSTAMVNEYYFDAIDRDFGPFFLTFSSYFPYNAKLCINGTNT